MNELFSTLIAISVPLFTVTSFFYDLSRDSRERANMRYRQPNKFVELRDRTLEWDRSLPAIPEDAIHHHVYTEETMAKSAG